MNNDFENEYQSSAPEGAPEPQPAPESTAVPAYEDGFPKKLPIRRIGILTMGVALIFTGVVALVATFRPSIDLTLIFKLSPALFILLGLEILISSFRHKSERLRFDFLSGFICFLLVCGGIFLSALPTVWNYFGPPAIQAREQLRDKAETDIYNRLRDNHEIRDFYLNVDHSYFTNDFGFTVSTDGNALHLYPNFELAGPYKNEQEFAAASRAILDRLADAPYSIKQVLFKYNNDIINYELSVSDLFQMNMSTEALTQLIETHYYDVNGNLYEENEFRDVPPEEVPQSSAAASAPTEAAEEAASTEPESIPLSPESSSAA